MSEQKIKQKLLKISTNPSNNNNNEKIRKNSHNNKNNSNNNNAFIDEQNPINEEEFSENYKMSSQNNNTSNISSDKKLDEISENPEKNFFSLNSISKCQCCNKLFNNNSNIPFLFKCSHFFCKNCIENYFQDEKGIKCPIDGYIAKNINELKVIEKLFNYNNNENNNNSNNSYENQNYTVHTNYNENENIDSNNINNLSNNNNNNNNENNIDNESEDSFCKIHNQKLSHYIEDTREIICIFCAFNKLQNNNKLTIKSLSDKIKDYLNEIESILELYQKFASKLQNIFYDFEENKKNTENKINEIFDKIINYLINIKNQYLYKIEDYIKENSKNINDKLEYFSEKIEIAEKIKENLLKFGEYDVMNINSIFDQYNFFINQINEKNIYDIELNKLNFQTDDESFIKFFKNYSNLKCVKINLNFLDNKTNHHHINLNGGNNKNLYNNNFLENKNFGFNVNNVILNNNNNDMNYNNLNNNNNNNNNFLFYNDTNDNFLRNFNINNNNEFINDFKEFNYKNNNLNNNTINYFNHDNTYSRFGIGNLNNSNNKYKKNNNNNNNQNNFDVTKFNSISTPNLFNNNNYDTKLNDDFYMKNSERIKDGLNKYIIFENGKKTINSTLLENNNSSSNNNINNTHINTYSYFNTFSQNDKLNTLNKYFSPNNNNINENNNNSINVNSTNNNK